MISNEELIKEIRKGNKNLETELYKNVEKLIIKTASMFYQRNKSLIKKIACIDYDDVLQIARMGFVISIEKFNLEKDFLFTTYLTNTIQLRLYSEFYHNKKINIIYEKDTNKTELDDNLRDSRGSNIDIKLMLEEIMECLTKREKEIIIDKFIVGLNPSELRNKYGVSTPAIRDIKNKALEKMTKKIRRNEYDICEKT